MIYVYIDTLIYTIYITTLTFLARERMVAIFSGIPYFVRGAL